MKEVRSFSCAGQVVRSKLRGNDFEPVPLARRKSSTSELHAAARLRLQDYLVESAHETGDGLPPEIQTSIYAVINGKRKAYRYMMFIGLLVAVTDRTLHPRCLQKKAGCTGAFDARSLGKEVVAPFDKEILKGRLGGSGDPFAGNPARLPMIERGNDVKSRADGEMLCRLYDVLEFAKHAEEGMRKLMFRYAYSVVLQRPATESSAADFKSTKTEACAPDRFFQFLESHTQGASAVATIAAFFRRFYNKETKVDVHPLTESGASSNEVGDIDLKFPDGRLCAVEVKDKTFKTVDVNHACEKALQAGVKRVVFSYGPAAARRRPNEGALTGYWLEKGVELAFMSVEDSLGVAMAASDVVLRREMAREINRILHEMNAPEEAMEAFAVAFGGGEA